ncbi:MAG: NADH-quinone oxidoreductase subunit C [Burkholderiales bacterium]|nr:NADH-quinone oxidoreductase subunit C [Burkholderiales bacterium]
MSEKLEALKGAVQQALQAFEVNYLTALNELTIEVRQSDYLAVCQKLKDDRALRFDQLIDLCGMDYSTYRNEVKESQIFAVVLHLLSVELNQRIRVRATCIDDDFPMVASVVDVWSAAGWYEREAFDLYGIVFQGNPDLRRILTDYGFMGHPFRKDFPLSGHVEMRYDPEQKRVIYQPVTIEPREITPRIIREEQYGGSR